MGKCTGPGGIMKPVVDQGKNWYSGRSDGQVGRSVVGTDGMGCGTKQALAMAADDGDVHVVTLPTLQITNSNHTPEIVHR